MNQFVLTVFQEGYLPDEALIMLKGGDAPAINPCATQPTAFTCSCNNATNTCQCNVPGALCPCNAAGAKYYA